MNKIVIGVATYKRPKMLERLLRAIETFKTNDDVHVLVADNDSAQRAGIAVVDRLLAGGYRFPLTSLVVESQGLTYTRNAILEFGFTDIAVDYIALVDDDQWPEPSWLEEMLKVQRETKADIVGAAVWPEFEITPPQWAIKSNVYLLDTSTTGLVDMLTGNGGILLSRNFTKLLRPPWYDHAYAKTGGEDVDLFVRLRAAGGRFARAARAVIHETFPASRVTLRWALARAYRSGNTDMRVLLRYHQGKGELIKEGAKIIGALIVYSVALVLFLWSPGRRVDAMCRLWRVAGKLAALQGSHYDEYATIHGK